MMRWWHYFLYATMLITPLPLISSFLRLLYGAADAAERRLEAPAWRHYWDAARLFRAAVTIAIPFAVAVERLSIASSLFFSLHFFVISWCHYAIFYYVYWLRFDFRCYAAMPPFLTPLHDYARLRAFADVIHWCFSFTLITPIYAIIFAAAADELMPARCRCRHYAYFMLQHYFRLSFLSLLLSIKDAY